VIFQDVVPFSGEPQRRRRRSGAKVEIGRNDFEGADLSRRLCTAQHQNQASSARLRWVQCLDNLQAPGTRRALLLVV